MAWVREAAFDVFLSKMTGCSWKAANCVVFFAKEQHIFWKLLFASQDCKALQKRFIVIIQLTHDILRSKLIPNY